ncbi:MAG: hypothetical protein ABSA47_04345 [Verrucomicrobiota bacterium]|jgi:hypothetical protein
MAIHHPVTEQLLILTKTYPSPSAKYRETTCVAAVNSSGQMRRLYPVPYRLLDGENQFQKWEWIRASISSADGDLRPESRHIDADSIQREGNIIKPKDGDWSERVRWIQPHIVPTFAALEARRQATGETLGFLRSSKIVELQISPVKQVDWTEADKIKLSQDGLFDSSEIKQRHPLRKLPVDFHYRYECATSGKPETNIHKLTDWEIGALYWNCVRSYGPNGWEVKFRHRLETDFAKKDLLLLMGTIHRFPDQWLIVGIVYPTKPPIGAATQIGLSLGQ